MKNDTQSDDNCREYFEKYFRIGKKPLTRDEDGYFPLEVNSAWLLFRKGWLKSLEWQAAHTQTPPASTVMGRDGFEKEASRFGLNLQWNVDSYFDSVTNIAFLIWQSKPAPISEDEAVDIMYRAAIKDYYKVTPTSMQAAYRALFSPPSPKGRQQC